MKIAYTSDIHLEFFTKQSLKKFHNKDSNILILAGDIYNLYYKNPIYQKFWSTVSKEFPQILYVLGNHEYYHQNFQDVLQLIKNDLLPYENVHILNNESITLDNVNFYGGTLWTNFNNNNFFYKNIAQNSMNDFNVIHNGSAFLTPDDTIKQFNSFISNLSNPTIVISHHSPSHLTVNKQYANHPLNHAYASSLEYILENNPIQYWIHGHIHNKITVPIYNTLVCCNAHGYIHEQNEFSYEFINLPQT